MDSSLKRNLAEDAVTLKRSSIFFTLPMLANRPKH